MELVNYYDTKEIIRRFSIGDYYDTLFIGWYEKCDSEKDYANPVHRDELNRQLTEEIGISCCIYYFVDNGTFAKDISCDFTSDEGIEHLSIGSKSISVVISVFTPLRVAGNIKAQIRKNIIALLEKIGFSASHIKRIPSKKVIYELPGQKELSF